MWVCQKPNAIEKTDKQSQLATLVHFSDEALPSTYIRPEEKQQRQEPLAAERAAGTIKGAGGRHAKESLKTTMPAKGEKTHFSAAGIVCWKYMILYCIGMLAAGFLIGNAGVDRKPIQALQQEWIAAMHIGGKTAFLQLASAGLVPLTACLLAGLCALGYPLLLLLVLLKGAGDGMLMLALLEAQGKGPDATSAVLGTVLCICALSLFVFAAQSELVSLQLLGAAISEKKYSRRSPQYRVTPVKLLRLYWIFCVLMCGVAAAAVWLFQPWMQRLLL